MKYKSKKLQNFNNKGFTLIELMVVMVIIGLLA
ncbi:MAG: prepilin-type N-terminal cleavage/methylation domain-containing protein, partial [Nitrospinota bacterium]|nr:prepilin-type N-terminal cleavage/methylation domain-containing protein [Nitrospinota bacterium]